jgi:hypothetical protein
LRPLSSLALGLLNLDLGREISRARERLLFSDTGVSQGTRNPEIFGQEEVMTKHTTGQDVMTRDPVKLPPCRGAV